MHDIDFVVTWVDGSDPEWLKEKNRYSPVKQNDDRDARYRDMDLMKYWFRAIEKHAPFVRKIHFITWGHIPSWLDTNNQKINIVNHKDFIPEEYLPLFNSNAIEMNMHRIKDLSEHFVYFNDDIFLNSDCRPEDFFINGKPVDMLAFQPVVANPNNPVMSKLLLNNSLVICKYFNKRENIKKQPGAYFHLGYPLLYFFYNILEIMFPLYTGFYSVHGHFPALKSTFNELWKLEPEIFNNTSKNKFRSDEDITIYLLRDWQKLSGNFVPKNIQKDFAYFEPKKDNKNLYSTILKQKKKILCINDSNLPYDFEKVKKELHDIFEKVYPDKSEFEL